ncbi:MAG: acyclic terpene utilization AtuA family protein, partial [Pseudomonadota bacterium]
ADIVITGRCVDSAVTLGACIHAFGWGRGDWDLLSAGSLAGHIIECGPQATGGNYTDWEEVADSLMNIGYPIAEVDKYGNIAVEKPTGTGGTVTVGTVGEQMLYEIGDPRAYTLPDVTCDFSEATITPERGCIRVMGAKGRPAPTGYKVSTTFADGWRAGMVWFFVGADAGAKGRAFAKAALARANGKLRALNAPAFDEELVEVIGDGSSYGNPGMSGDVAVKLAVKHRDPRAAGLILKEATGLGLSAPPGLSGFSGGRPKPSPVVRLFSFLIPKEDVPIQLHMDGRVIDLGAEPAGATEVATAAPVPEAPGPTEATVPLIRLAFARSGDKGDKANVGILPRDPAYAPYVWAALDEAEISRRFAHYLDGPNARAERFYMPGTGAMNILLHDVLGGGGVASLRNDPQAKTYGQILLEAEIPVSREIAEAVS